MADTIVSQIVVVGADSADLGRLIEDTASLRLNISSLTYQALLVARDYTVSDLAVAIRSELESITAVALAALTIRGGFYASNGKADIVVEGEDRGFASDAPTFRAVELTALNHSFLAAAIWQETESINTVGAAVIEGRTASGNRTGSIGRKDEGIVAALIIDHQRHAQAPIQAVFIAALGA